MTHTSRSTNFTPRLWEEGYVTCEGVQLMRVDFSQQYEDAITQTEVQNQETMTQQYNQTVQDQLQSIENLKVKTAATIKGISARAKSKAAMIINNAAADGVGLVSLAL